MNRFTSWWLALGGAFMMLLALNPIADSYAADDSINLIQVTAILATDSDGNNFANIGDIVQVQVVLNNADGGCVAQSTTVVANMQAYGGTTNQVMNCVADNGGAGDVFDLGFPVVDAAANGIDVPANNGASQIQVVAADADENNGAGLPNPQQNTNSLGDGVIDTAATNGVDTSAIIITDANIVVNFVQDQNTPNVAEIGDILGITWDSSGTGDNNPDTNPGTVFANLSAFEGPAMQTLTNAGEIYSTQYTIVQGTTDASNLNVTISAEDDAQNGTGNVADSSNITVDNVTLFSSGSRRRAEGLINQPVIASGTTYFSTYTPDKVESCNCLDGYSRVYGISIDTIDNVGLGIGGPLFMNPICLESLDTVHQEDTPAEATYREALRNKLDAGKALVETGDAVSEAEDAYNKAEGEFQDERIDRYQGVGDSAEYDKKKAARDAAWANLRDAKEIENDAKNDYNQAYWEERQVGEDADLIDPARRRQIIEEELAGGKKADQLFQNDTTAPIFNCFDIDLALTSGSVDPLDTEAWKEATTTYEICLEDCKLEEENLFTPSLYDYDSDPAVAGGRRVEKDDALDGGSSEFYDGIFGYRFDAGSSVIEEAPASSSGGSSPAQKDEQLYDGIFGYQYDDTRLDQFFKHDPLLPENACEPKYEIFDNTASNFVIDSFFDPDQFHCFNPKCLELGSDENPPGDSPAESDYRQAFRDKIDAGKKLTEAMDATREAKEAYENAEGEFQDARIDRYEGIGNTADYDSKKTARDDAWQKYQDARRAENDARNDYNQAYWDFKELSEDEDLLERETRNRIIREELNGGQPEITISDITFSCYDPICGLNSGVSSSAQTIIDSFEDVNECLTISNIGSSGDDGVSIVIPEAQYSTEDFGPFTPLSGITNFPFGSTYALDISGHPAEPFIIDLYAAGVVNGVGNGDTYDPDGLTTRAALLKVGYITFGVQLTPGLVEVDYFIDIPDGAWFAEYFYLGAQRGDVTGADPENTPIGQRRANPAEIANLVEGLAFFTRIGDIDLNLAHDYQSEIIDASNPQWWHPVWNWAEMYGVVNPDAITLSEAGADGDSKAEEVKGDRPTDQVSRAKMAEIAVKVKATKDKKKGPCNCDAEKAAHEAAQKAAMEAQAQADADQATADASEAAAKKAEAAAKAAQAVLDDLAQYDDDSSSATGEDDVTITTGDLRLMELAKAQIDEQVANGDKSLEEGQKEKEGINKDILPELRKKRDELTAKAAADALAANKAAQAARSQADSDAAKAKASAEAAKKAAEAEAAAKKAYEDCLEKCEIINKKWAEEQRRLEAERRRKAAERARQRKIEQQRRDAERKRQQQEDERRRQQINDAAAAGQSTSGSSGGGDSAPPPVLSDEDKCKAKLAEAIVERGKQIAKTRGADAVSKIEPPDTGKTSRTVAAAVGKMITVAAKDAIQNTFAGAATVAKLASSTLPAAYKLWADYVGEAIKGAGTRIINNRRICAVIKHSTSGKWGYEKFPPGQVVYWEKDANGNYQVIVMGPGDNVTTGQCG